MALGWSRTSREPWLTASLWLTPLVILLLIRLRDKPGVDSHPLMVLSRAQASLVTEAHSVRCLSILGANVSPCLVHSGADGLQYKRAPVHREGWGMLGVGWLGRQVCASPHQPRNLPKQVSQGGSSR